MMYTSILRCFILLTPIICFLLRKAYGQGHASHERGQMTLKGESLEFTCPIDAKCVEVPEGDKTCMPALCIMNGRTLKEIHLVKIIPNQHRNGTSSIDLSPTAKNWEINLKTSWKTSNLTMHVTVKKFNISKAGTYFCYDGDSYTSGYDYIYQSQLIVSSVMKKENTTIHEHTSAGKLTKKTVAIKPGFSTRISCTFVGTPGVFSYTWLLTCPGQPPRPFTHTDFGTRKAVKKFDEDKAYQFQVEIEEKSFSMLTDYDGCDLTCTLIEHHAKSGKKITHNVSNVVTLKVDYSPVDDVRFTKAASGDFVLKLITIANLTLSTVMFSAAMFVYYKKGMFSKDNSAAETKKRLDDDFEFLSRQTSDGGF